MLRAASWGSIGGMGGRALAAVLLCWVALVRFTPALEAQVANASAGTTAAIPRGINYSGGQLTIEAQNATLSELLTKVAAATGIKIEIPVEANAERIPMVRLGPGSARQVLASLLRETHFNFLIAESEADPERLQSVLVMPVDTRDSAPAPKDVEAAARLPRFFGGSAEPGASERRVDTEAPHAGASGAAETAPAPDPLVPSAGSGAIAEETSASPQAGTTSQAARSAALSPPPVLNQESISQQLQQMYQQRVQMIQQGRQTGSAGN